MSTKALFWALEQKIPGGPKSVLIHLADWYNTHEDAAWPKHEQLAEKAGWSVPTVKRHIDWLVDNGLVMKENRISHGRQISNKYRLSVGVMAFQGKNTVAQSELPGSSDLPPSVDQNELPSNTIKNTIKDTLKGGEPPKEDELKFKEGGKILDNMEIADSEYWGMDKDEAFLKVRKGIVSDESGKLIAKPSALEKLWKFSRKCASETDYGKYAPLTKIERGQLLLAWDRVGEDLLDIVWDVLSDWSGFCRRAEQESGAFNSPTKPNVVYFTKHIEAAINFTPASTELGEGWITEA